MKTVKEKIIHTIEIKKSKFITLLFQVHEIESIPSLLKQVKIDYPNANHYCYAYIIDDYKKCSDDGEPCKTAGVPILNVLEKEHLDHILCIVIRYFGGIKLGAGGLVRAYKNATTEALKEATEVPLVLLSRVILTFSYPQEKTIMNEFPNIEIIHKTYLETIMYECYFTEQELQKLSTFQTIHYQILDTSYRVKKEA